MGKEKKFQNNPGLGIQIHHEKGPIQAQARNQKEVGSQGYALDVEETSSATYGRRQIKGVETCRKRNGIG